MLYSGFLAYENYCFNVNFVMKPPPVPRSIVNISLALDIPVVTLADAGFSGISFIISVA